MSMKEQKQPDDIVGLDFSREYFSSEYFIKCWIDIGKWLGVNGLSDFETKASREESINDFKDSPKRKEILTKFCYLLLSTKIFQSKPIKITGLIYNHLECYIECDNTRYQINFSYYDTQEGKNRFLWIFSNKETYIYSYDYNQNKLIPKKISITSGKLTSSWDHYGYQFKLENEGFVLDISFMDYPGSGKQPSVVIEIFQRFLSNLTDPIDFIETFKGIKDIFGNDVDSLSFKTELKAKASEQSGNTKFNVTNCILVEKGKIISFLLTEEARTISWSNDGWSYRGDENTITYNSCDGSATVTTRVPVKPEITEKKGRLVCRVNVEADYWANAGQPPKIESIQGMLTLAGAQIDEKAQILHKIIPIACITENQLNNISN